MTIDEHTPCPTCPHQVRDVYAAARRVLERERPSTSIEHEELYLALEVLRPFVDAHHANQRHSHSDELAAARAPRLEVIDGPVE